MDWRDRLLPASFRGVPFWVLSDSYAGGRRVAVHEYPLRDVPYAEDLGRRARGYRLDAVVVGPHYDLQLKALVWALEGYGPGLLTHPHHGLLSVAVTGFRVEHSTQEGGMARVEMDLVESGENVFPLGLLDTLSGALGAVSGLLAAVQRGVALAYRILGVVSLVRDAGRGLLSHLLTSLTPLVGLVLMGTTDRAEEGQAIASAERDLDRLSGSGALMGETLVTRISALRTRSTAPWAAYQALRRLDTWGDDLPAVPLTTPARIDEAANQALIIAAVRDAALANACAAALSAIAEAGDASALANLAAGVPATAGEIRALRTTLLAAIDARQASADDSLYQAWAGLRAAIAKDLAERALKAPLVRQVTVGDTTPALVLAYRLYQDAGREPEIVRRNAVRHPGFLPGGQPLDVLVEQADAA